MQCGRVGGRHFSKEALESERPKGFFRVYVYVIAKYGNPDTPFAIRLRTAPTLAYLIMFVTGYEGSVKGQISAITFVHWIFKEIKISMIGLREGPSSASAARPVCETAFPVFGIAVAVNKW